MKRKILGALLGLTILMNTCSAQEVTVTGSGTDRDSATRDAMRMAVEQVVGTFIDSKTLVEKSAVALDEVYAKSQGYVRNVRILNEGQGSAGYMVTATVDVDTNPDSALMDRMSMIMMLNDPRIAVVIEDEVQSSENVASDSGTKKFNVGVENVINNKLLELGFSHVADAGLVSKLKNSKLLKTMLKISDGDGNMDTLEEGDVSMLGIDYLVLGKCQSSANKITVPDKTGAYVETQMNSGKVSLTAKIIKFATGEIVATELASGQGVDANEFTAKNKAAIAAADIIGKSLEGKFRRLASVVTGNVQITCSMNEMGQLDEFIQALRGISGVQNVYIREKNGSKVLLDVDSNQKPHYIFQKLKENGLGALFLEKITNNSMELSL